MKENSLFALLLLLLFSIAGCPAFAQHPDSRQQFTPKGATRSTMTQGAHSSVAAFIPAPRNCFDNSPLPDLTYGSPYSLTTLDANGGTISFGQNAAILGDLYLEDGTFEVTPGTTLTFRTSPVNGEPTGKIIVGLNATLRLNNANITSICNSWFGIVLDTAVPYVQLIITNNSRVSNAKYGVYNVPSTNPNNGTYDNYYRITNSTFSNNLNHIYDQAFHRTPASASLIEACVFTSDKMQMLSPYQYVSPTSNYITYEALHINPFTFGSNNSPPNSGSVRVTGNFINNAVYGIMNHYGDRDYVYN